MARAKKEPKQLLTWSEVLVPIDELHRLQHNPRKATEKGRKDLKKSIDKFGLPMPLVINMDRTIIGGHQRLDDFIDRGQTHVPCRVPERQLTAEEVDELCIRLNQNIAGVWDGDLLKEFFPTKDLIAWGMEEEELRDLDGVNLNTRGDDSHSSLESTQDGDDEDPRLADVATVSELGDLFEIRTADGKVHRLLCGSATEPDEVQRLFGPARANMVCADPPYGVAYVSKTGLQRTGRGSYAAYDNADSKRIKNDALDEYGLFFQAFIEAVPVADYNTWYLFMNGQELHTLRLAFEAGGGNWADYLVWVKNHFALGRKDYNCQHEFIMYGWMGKHEFHGEMTSKTLFDYDEDPAHLPVEELVRQVRLLKENASTVIRHNKPSKNPYHPTMKPVELVGRLIRDGSAPRAIVYDGFVGSGTTLLASEKYERCCYAMDNDPFYFDVAIGRFCQWMEENERGFELLHLADASGKEPASPKTIGHFLMALEERLSGPGAGGNED